VSEKDYREWMPVKAGVNNRAARPPAYKKGEIWACNVGENIGYENDGKGRDFMRPILIINGINAVTCLAVPLSTTRKRTRYHYEFDGNTGKQSAALLHQLRVMDTSRLRYKIGKAGSRDLQRMTVIIAVDVLGIKELPPLESGGQPLTGNK
jgi:mRNA-degrading endonuclease toxin of MazEF toxin-antitoxin module